MPMQDKDRATSSLATHSKYLSVQCFNFFYLFFVFIFLFIDLFTFFWGGGEDGGGTEAPLVFL